jgi:glycosyltransferase involved in cell wall biosynthesis
VTRVRVLQVLEATLGGTRRYLEFVCAHLDPATVELGLAYSPTRAEPAFLALVDRCRRQGVALFAVPMARAIRPFADLRGAMALRRVVQKFRPEVVHAHSSKAGALARIAVLGLGRHRPRILYSPHSLAVHIGWRYLVLERILAHLADGYIAVSAAEREELLALGLGTPGTIGVARQAVDPAVLPGLDRAGARKALGLSPDAPIIVGVGRLSLQKDPVTFVRVMREAIRARPDLRAVWVGDGELRPEVEAAIDAAGIRNSVTITGWSDQVPLYLAAADAFLHTARYEGISTACAEALAAGLPVVAAGTPGTTEVVRPDETGLTFPIGDATRGSTQLLRLIENPQLAARLTNSGRQWVLEAMSPAGLGRTLSDLYARTAAPGRIDLHEQLRQA